MSKACYKINHGNFYPESSCPYCEIDRIKAELEEAYAELAISIKERIDLGNQLASARAEVERLKEEIRHYEDQGLWIPDKAEEARKYAAMEIIEQLDKQQPYHENATYLFIRDYIVKTFGLEW